MNIDAEIIKRIFISFVILVAVIVCSSLAWNIQREYKLANEYASVEAQVSHDRDILFRRWISMHGGVYVPVTNYTPANPLLNGVLERDIVTNSGRKLTLINPAYMTRQVFDLDGESGVIGHFTSLNPIRKENKADKWETNALNQCDGGQYEFRSISKIGGQDYLREMYALKTEKECLSCHTTQGYKLGDIIGGISLSVPLEKYRTVAQANIVGLIKIHLISFLLILIVIFVRYRIALNQIE